MGEKQTNYSKLTFVVALLILAVAAIAVLYPDKPASRFSITVRKGEPEAAPINPRNHWDI